MNIPRNRRKYSELKEHRIAQYEKALDGLINGTHPPEYLAKRWDKLKPLVKNNL